MTALYHVLVIVFGIFALISGYRQGIVRQMASVLGLSFGVVCAYLGGELVSDCLTGYVPHQHDALVDHFGARFFASAIIYCIIYLLFQLMAPLWHRIAHLWAPSVAGSLAGALFSLLKWMMGLSIAFNCWLWMTADTGALKCAADADGNLAGTVMLLAPRLFGTDDAEDLALRIQLREARKISVRNYTPSGGVLV